MQDQAKLQELALKALSDKDFIRRLLETPESVLRSEGIEPTPEILDSLKGISVEDAQKIASAFNTENKAM